MTPKCHLN